MEHHLFEHHLFGDLILITHGAPSFWGSNRETHMELFLLGDLIQEHMEQRLFLDLIEEHI